MRTVYLLDVGRIMIDTEADEVMICNLAGVVKKPDVFIPHKTSDKESHFVNARYFTAEVIIDEVKPGWFVIKSRKDWSRMSVNRMERNLWQEQFDYIDYIENL